MTDDPKILIARYEQLIQEKDDNLLALKAARRRLQSMKHSAWAGHSFAQSSFDRIQTQVRLLGMRDQELARKLAPINRALHEGRNRAQYGVTLEHCFFKVAREQLSPAVFEKLYAAAEQLKEVELKEREVEMSFWDGYLRTAEQLGHDRPVDRQARRMLSGPR